VDEITIEKGVPVPTRQDKKKRCVAAMKQLEVGDSFLLPAHWTLSNLYAYAREIGIRIRGAKTEKGFRIWRIE
jgi:hypothetical protein